MGIDAVTLLKIAGEAGSARGAVAFASQEFRRGPALVARGIEPYKIRHGFDVLRDTVKLLRRLAGNSAAVARRNWINEHEVAAVQKRHLVIHDLVRRRTKRAPIPHLHAPRAKQAEM